MTISPQYNVNNTNGAYSNYNNYQSYATPTQYPSEAPVPLKVVEYPDSYMETYEKEGSSSRKWGVGIASALIPGLGQAINGEWGKAAAFFFGNLVLSFIPLVGIITNIGFRIWSAANAVNNTKEEYTIVRPKAASEPALNTVA